MGWTRFIEERGTEFGLACGMLGMRPREVLELPPLERELAVGVAAKKEEWRLRQISKIMGGD